MLTDKCAEQYRAVLLRAVAVLVDAAHLAVRIMQVLHRVASHLYRLLTPGL